MSYERPTLELPGEAAAGEQPPSGTSGLQARRGAAHFALTLSTVIKTPAPLPQSSPPQAPETTASAPFFELSVGKCSRAQSATTQSRCATRTTSPAFSLSAVRASCRLRQLRCWVVPCRDSSSTAGSVRRVPSLHSSVRLRRGYTRPLFLHTSAGENPVRSVPGSRDAALRAAGAACVRTSQPHPAPERQCQAFGHQRHTSIERCIEPSRLRPVRPSVHPSRPVSSAPLLRPDGLRSIPLQSPAAPTTTDRLPGQPPLRSGSYGTARLTAAAQGHPAHPRGCETGQHHRLTGSLTLERQSKCDRRTPPERQQKVYIYTTRGQRLPPLLCF